MLQTPFATKQIPFDFEREAGDKVGPNESAVASKGHEAPVVLSPEQLRILRTVSTGWAVPVVSTIAESCVKAGRLDQYATDQYVFSLAAVEALGPNASIEQIVDVLSTFTRLEEGGLLYLAVICQLYSEEVAHEAYRRVGRWPSLKGRGWVKTAKREYQRNMLESWSRMKAAMDLRMG